MSTKERTQAFRRPFQKRALQASWLEILLRSGWVYFQPARHFCLHLTLAPGPLPAGVGGGAEGAGREVSARVSRPGGLDTGCPELRG